MAHSSGSWSYVVAEVASDIGGQDDVPEHAIVGNDLSDNLAKGLGSLLRLEPPARLYWQNRRKAIVVLIPHIARVMHQLLLAEQAARPRPTAGPTHPAEAPGILIQPTSRAYP